MKGVKTAPKIENISPDTIFGVNAGKVWEAIHDKNELTTREIANRTDLTESEVYGALGWLGKEGKVTIIFDGKNYKYKVY
ncbi:MAG: winged helix-turn-helix domain-containing protein [Candidatus Thermoplasmatota archaeon]